MATPLPSARRTGHLDDAAIVTGVPRGRFGLYQRRVRPAVFGEPLAAELVPSEVHPAQPHAIAFDAWLRMRAAAEADGVDAARLDIHSAYRSVALQERIWAYRLDERRRQRAETGLPALDERALARLQMKWTARPGTSAHHTGLALDLALYHLGKRGSKRSPVYAWLAAHARRFGFYPYLPEGWHWEYNPPGLALQIAELRSRIAAGLPHQELLRAPAAIPIAPPGR